MENLYQKRNVQISARKLKVALFEFVIKNDGIGQKFKEHFAGWKLTDWNDGKDFFSFTGCSLSDQLILSIDLKYDD